MKRYLYPLASLLLLSACGDGANSGAGARPERPATRVEVAVVERQKSGQSIVRSGTLHADREVKLITEEEGRIAALPVHEGDRVNEGDLLLQLNDSLIKAELSKARAQRSQAALDLQRLQKLKRNQLVSEDELARARTALDVAKAEEELLQTRLRHTRIKAPFDGVISARLAEPGDALSSFTHVLTLTDDTRLLAKLQLSELLLPAVAVGDAVSMTLDALGDTRLSGHILRIYPTVDALSRQGTLEVMLDDPPAGARPGQLCRATLKLRPQPRLVVPFAALRRDTQGEYVFVVGADNKVARTAVISGINLGDRIEIVQGLSQDQQVVINGFLGLADGMPVDIETKADRSS
jgi:membrane fusion protein (multidrug efflux system)